ncbi:MAG: enoyl-CoA hydratase/isomerase family protein [Candidatus Hydrogenedentes bacterium]|nr:enoyl-CoA hydratase/isomerase family protein [Candidatus Hydrogenedentota bacterium]
MSYENIVLDRQEPVLVITLNRPKANALSMDLVTEIGQAIDDAASDPAIRAVVITGGEGRFFAAGADIPSLQTSLDDPLAEGSLLAQGLDTMNRIEACDKPIIAAVNGIALGGGCELALACHLRIAAVSAVFGQPEINLGIIPGWGGTHRLPMIIGDGRAREWLLTGRQVSAEEALQAGLVSRLVPAAQLREAALELARTVAGKPAVAMRVTLNILRARALRPEDGQQLEAQGFIEAARSQDAAEGISAFLEKRQPEFTGA